MKRIIFTTAILFTGIIVMAYLYFSGLRQNTQANNLALNAIASSSGLIFSFDNDKHFYEILGDQDLLQRLLGEKKKSLFNSLYNTISKQKPQAKSAEEQKVYIGFIPGKEQSSADFLITTQGQKIQNPGSLTGGSVSNISLQGRKTLYKATLNDSNEVYLYFKDNLICISNQQEILASLAKENIKESKFSKYVKSQTVFNKNSLANLFINFETIPAFIKTIISGPLNGELDVFNKQDAFANLSYNFSREKILFSGTSQLNQNDSYLKLFTGLPGIKTSINVILPVKTANYTIYAVNNYRDWQKQLNEWQKEQKAGQSKLADEKRISQKYGLDLQQVFPQYFKNEFITFQLASGEKLGAVALNNGEKTGQLLLDISNNYSPDIRIFKEPGIPFSYFGEPFRKFEKPYYTIIDNYLIMASYASSIQVFLNAYRNNELLVNDNNYQQFFNQLSVATISHYVSKGQSMGIFGRNLRSAYYKQLKAKEGLGLFTVFSYQLTGDKGKFITNMLLIPEAGKMLAADSLRVN